MPVCVWLIGRRQLGDGRLGIELFDPRANPEFPFQPVEDADDVQRIGAPIEQTPLKIDRFQIEYFGDDLPDARLDRIAFRSVNRQDRNRGSFEIRQRFAIDFSIGRQRSHRDCVKTMLVCE